MKSVMTPQELFSKVSKPDIQRSTFNRSHGYKTTFDAGKLIPFYVDEALPGDTFNCKASIFGRLATPLKPIMDNIQMDIHFFSVPIRLVWDNFQKFMGEQENPGDSTDYLMPTQTSGAGGYGEKTVHDYMGIPTLIETLEHRTDFFRAYNLIWNEWYRDENIQDSVTVDKGDGPDASSDYTTILPRGKRKDYFTSALPWAQKADPVTIPLGTSAPIYGTAMSFNNVDDTSNRVNIYDDADTATANLRVIKTTGDFAFGGNAQSGNGTIEADLTEASSQTINQLREAFQIQKLFERDARGGTRYTEMNYAHFGVISPDQRLQRPEYLGGGTMDININPVAQQSESNTTPQGNLAGFGTVSGQNKGFVKSFVEHEIIIGLISARADLNYQQGLNRMWSRSTRFDHYFPSFAHLGEQSVLNKEIYAIGTGTDPDQDDEVFGYQERYADYRYKPSLVTSDFRSNATASLDAWHLAQDFTALPALNDTFIEENPPIDRVIAVPAEPQFILDTYMDLKCTRPMPTYSIPGYIDHF